MSPWCTFTFRVHYIASRFFLFCVIDNKQQNFNFDMHTHKSFCIINDQKWVSVRLLGCVETKLHLHHKYYTIFLDLWEESAHLANVHIVASEITTVTSLLMSVTKVEGVFPEMPRYTDVKKKKKPFTSTTKSLYRNGFVKLLVSMIFLLVQMFRPPTAWCRFLYEKKKERKKKKSGGGMGGGGGGGAGGAVATLGCWWIPVITSNDLV